MATKNTPEILFKENLGLVHFIARKYWNKSNASYYEDYVQEGMIGLWKACKTYDTSKGTTFATYASTCITNQILMYFRHLSRPILKHTVSYDSDIRFEDGSTVKLSETLIDPKSQDIFEEIDNKLSLSSRTFSRLNDREKEVLYRIFYLDQNQHEVAEILGISQSYISRVQKSALKKLRDAVTL